MELPDIMALFCKVSRSKEEAFLNGVLYGYGAYLALTKPLDFHGKPRSYFKFKLACELLIILWLYEMIFKLKCLRQTSLGSKPPPVWRQR